MNNMEKSINVVAQLGHTETKSGNFIYLLIFTCVGYRFTYLYIVA